MLLCVGRGGPGGYSSYGGGASAGGRYGSYGGSAGGDPYAAGKWNLRLIITQV